MISLLSRHFMDAMEIRNFGRARTAFSFALDNCYDASKVVNCLPCRIAIVTADQAIFSLKSKPKHCDAKVKKANDG